ncbi:MAG TPA: hypothetical protein VFN38_18135 [Gemmatimonadaceae bacterium]|nr:hypothetical protein [Gemmatimonadaceae bacterium]
MNIAVQLEPSNGTPPAVEFRWDTDTDILTARLEAPEDGVGPSGALELEGADGAWLILDVVKGRILGLEVAVWPEVQKRPTLATPSTVEDARVLVPLRASQPGAVLLEVETSLLAEADEAERTIHFRVGVKRDVRTIRLGRDLLLDVDPQSRIAGLWLLNVPPFPST